MRRHNWAWMVGCVVMAVPAASMAEPSRQRVEADRWLAQLYTTDVLARGEAAAQLANAWMRGDDEERMELEVVIASWREQEQGRGDHAQKALVEAVCARATSPEARLRFLDATSNRYVYAFDFGEAQQCFMPWVADGDARVRAETVEALAYIWLYTNDVGPLTWFVDRLGDPAPEVRREALSALGRLDGKAYAEDIAEQLSHTDSRVRTQAALAIERLNLTRYRPAVMRQLDDADTDVRTAARLILDRWGTAER